jgi:CheY-like chemotaxis protein/REP element-mobilizing transposase RayT
MAKYILAASPDTSFRETLRTGLTDAGGYSVTLAASGADVLSSIGNLAFDVAILDSQIPDLPLPSLVDAVRLKHPKVKVLVVPPTDPFSALTLEECGADVFINKPFFLPDLLETIQKQLREASGEKLPVVETPFEEKTPAAMRDIFGEEIAKVNWDLNDLPTVGGFGPSETLILPLEDIIAETQPQIAVVSGSKKNTGALQEIPPDQFLEMEELTKWFSESTARAAILIRGVEVIATCGEMEAEDTKKLAEDVPARFTTSGARELIRFFPLRKGNGNALLYAATIGNEKYIVLIYDGNASYSLIRGQAERLRKQLTEAGNPPRVPSQEVSEAWAVENSTAGETEPGPTPISEDQEETILQAGEQEPTGEDQLQPQEAEPGPPDKLEQPTLLNEENLESEGVQRENLGGVETEQQVEAIPLPVTEEHTEEVTQGEEEYPWLAAGAASIALTAAAGESSSLQADLPPAFPWGDEKNEGSKQSDKDNVMVDEKESSATDAVSPDKKTTAELVMKTPETPGTQENLRIFILVPTDPRVFLTGKLAADLGVWFQEICDSMHLELDALAVRPEYVRIGVVTAPEIKDDLIVTTFRDDSARKVASNYPQMALDPDSPIFWADDFLRINPVEPPDQSELNAFIHHLRS